MRSSFSYIKLLKQLGVLLIFIFIVTFILTLVMPRTQTIERTVNINAPADRVYEKLKSLDFFNQFSVWGRRDSTIKNVITGTDGTTGAASTWTGDPNASGTGIIRILALEPQKQVRQSIEFLTPRKGRAVSEFNITGNGNASTVTWTFVMSTPRPWNVFNLFYSLEKQVGADFDEGLQNAKKLIEGTATTADPVSTVKRIDLPPTTYAVIRQKVSFTDIMDFYTRHWEMLDVEMQAQHLSPGTRTGFIYEWDEKNRVAELGAAISLKEKAEFENRIISVENIAASRAIYIDHNGPGSTAFENFPALKKYLAENDLKESGPRIIQFGPVPRVIFPVD